MVAKLIRRWISLSFALQAVSITVLALAALGWMGYTQAGFVNLWLTADQQGRWAFEQRDYAEAASRFIDPAWQGVAHYRTGEYAEAAGAFARLGTAEGFFNRGNAFMKGFEYAKAITAYEQAVIDAPDWRQAAENLALARYTLDYIEGAREQSATGKLEADDIVYDNDRNRGQEIQVDRESALQAESAEKWMRSVDTETAEFLRSRFRLEASRRNAL